MAAQRREDLCLHGGVRKELRKELRQVSQPWRLAATPLDLTVPVQVFSPII